MRVRSRVRFGNVAARRWRFGYRNRLPLERFTVLSPLGQDATPTERMRHDLKTKAGRALYAKRKGTVEPVIDIVKSVLGFRQFSARAGYRRSKASGAWWRWPGT